jgi:hypothetical protein
MKHIWVYVRPWRCHARLFQATDKTNSCNIFIHNVSRGQRTAQISAHSADQLNVNYRIAFSDSGIGVFKGVRHLLSGVTYAEDGTVAGATATILTYSLKKVGENHSLSHQTLVRIIPYKKCLELKKLVKQSV